MEDTSLGIFEDYDNVPEPLPIQATATMVEDMAGKLGGSAGLSGVDAVNLHNWLLRYGTASESLRTELAAWAEWLGNESPSWAAYRAMMMNRLVPLDKNPGTLPAASLQNLSSRFAGTKPPILAATSISVQASRPASRPQSMHWRMIWLTSQSIPHQHQSLLRHRHQRTLNLGNHSHKRRVREQSPAPRLRRTMTPQKSHSSWMLAMDSMNLVGRRCYGRCVTCGRLVQGSPSTATATVPYF